MTKREPEAVVTAHLMDPMRRELYVEGSRDFFFLSFLLGNKINPNAIIKPIAAVNLPNVELGGERGRLLDFANWLDNQALPDISIRFFADADCDRLMGNVVPPRVWLTDPRDMEGYTLIRACIEKVLRVGFGTSTISANTILGFVCSIGRKLGLLRLLSERDNLNLPFQATSLRRYLRVYGDDLRLNIDAYLQTLLQNAEISLTRKPEILESLNLLEQEFDATCNTEIVHGKDAFCIIEKVLSRYRVTYDEVKRLLWTSFEESFVERGTTLAEVQTFLTEPVNV